MRIDMLLKHLCMVKTRSQARKGIEGGFVKLNGRATKPGQAVHEGDILEIRYPHKIRVVEITGIPERQIARKDQDRFVRVIREDPVRTGDGDWHD